VAGGNAQKKKKREEGKENKKTIKCPLTCRCQKGENYLNKKSLILYGGWKGEKEIVCGKSKGVLNASVTKKTKKA